MWLDLDNRRVNMEYCQMFVRDGAHVTMDMTSGETYQLQCENEFDAIALFDEMLAAVLPAERALRKVPPINLLTDGEYLTIDCSEEVHSDD